MSCAFEIRVFFISSRGVGLLFSKSIIRCRTCQKTCCTSNQICCLLYNYFPHVIL